MFIRVKKIKLEEFNINCFKIALKCIKFKNQSSLPQRFYILVKKMLTEKLYNNDFLLFCFREKNLWQFEYCNAVNRVLQTTCCIRCFIPRHQICYALDTRYLKNKQRLANFEILSNEIPSILIDSISHESN